jgi:hypothetical protein
MTRSFVTSYVGLYGQKGERPFIDHVRIPIIQRDYAQGRQGDAVQRIRAAFLAVLHEAVAGGAPVSLDFVYGDVKGGILEPLDGQQRLTTLFLLHVYVAHRAGELSSDQTWTRFTYTTRGSARLFCKRLVERPPPEGKPLESRWIIDQPWYLHTWQNDPTIQSMLVMLDAIHDLFADLEPTAAWQRLTDPAVPAVSFHLLPIAELQLTDQLYIKMNSRGKPLTQFENFKARFEKMLEDSCPDRVKEFALKVDGAWSDMLWPYRGDDDVIDDEFLRYFHFVTELCTWSEGGHASDDVEALARRVYGPENPRSGVHLQLLVQAFDTWCGAGISGWFDVHFALQSTHQGSADTTRVFITGQRGQASPDLFHAACMSYGERRGKGREFPLPHTLYLYAVLLHRLRSTTDFPRRLRVLRNLLEASGNEVRIDRMPALLRDTEAIIVDGDLDRVDALNQAQVHEEALKRAFLEENSELQQVLFRLEDHPLLRGCLGAFALDAGAFSQRSDAFQRLFADETHYPVLTGALLACGDYARQVNWRFFQLGSPTHEAVWRDVLTGAARDGQGSIRDALGKLLDRVAAANAPVPDTLRAVVDEWLLETEKDGIYSWRTYLVKYPVMREGESGRYAGWNGQLGYLLCMLRGERVSGYYRDPYLLAIHRLSGVGDAATDPWYTGYEDRPRWLELERSGAALRCTETGFELKGPSNEEHRGDFVEVCTARGIGLDGLLQVPQVDRVDTVDRIPIGAELLKAMVGAGL